MNKSKVLFVWFVPLAGINNGGGLVNKTVNTIAESILGKENVHSYYVNEQRLEDNLLLRGKASINCILGHFNGLSNRKVKEITSLAVGFEHVFLTSSLMGTLAKALRKNGFTGKISVLFHNVEQKYYESITPLFRPDRKIKIHNAAHNEQLCCDYADNIIALNSRDAEGIFKNYGRKPDFIWPLSINDVFDSSEIDKEIMTPQSQLNCLFVGSSFKSNTDAIIWFANKVMPKVNIKMTVVGKGMASLKSRLPQNPNIEVHGTVADLSPFYNNADYVILPIFTGSGMKTKTCEALMYGKNMIGTTEAFEGYDFDTSRLGACCNNADEFIDALHKAMEHPVKRFNSYARDIYEQKYSLASSMKLFEEIL